MNKISIGVLTYKRTDYLFSLIEDLNKIDHCIELILVNNNEDYELEESILSAIENDKINLRYISDGINYGVSCGRRKIVESCDSEYIIFLDDDVHIPNINLIYQECIRLFESDLTLGAIAFNIIDAKKNINNKYEIPHKNKKIDMGTDFYTYLVIGAGFALRTESVKNAGNFSDVLGPYGFEEIDVAFKIINCQYQIKYSSNCVVYHKKSPDGRFSSDLVNYYSFVNRCIIARQHLKMRYVISCLVVRGLYLLYKTKNIKLLVRGLSIIFSVSKRDKFNGFFYKYCKRVNAFLYY